MTGKYDPPLEDRPISDIMYRIGLINLVIRSLKEDNKTKDDPRLPEWLEENTRMLSDLNNEIDRRNKLSDKPETITINLKAASLTGRVPGVKNG